MESVSKSESESISISEYESASISESNSISEYESQNIIESETISTSEANVEENPTESEVDYGYEYNNDKRNTDKAINEFKKDVSYGYENSDSNVLTDKNNVVKTGDETDISKDVILAGVGLVGMAALGKKNKKSTKE
jgi:hypothetical protein